MANPLEGKRYISGKYFTVEYDGDILGEGGSTLDELSSVETNISITREEINQAGELNPAYKLSGTSGTGTLIFNKVYTRIKKKVLEELKKGKDTTFDLTLQTTDPDSFGTETVVIRNILFNDLDLFNGDVETVKLQETYTFNFRVKDVEIKDSI